MDRQEIYEELKMSYEELVGYLLQKYGGAKYDYFPNEECRSKNKKVTRTKEGLYCHHIDEDKGGNLANAFQARMQSYEWQRKERLVYCNILEHLILHIKIAVLRQRRLLYTHTDIPDFFTTGGIYLICEEINSMFLNQVISQQWIKCCFNNISENYKEYIDILKALLFYIDKNYKGEKNKVSFLHTGAVVNIEDNFYTIVDISYVKEVITVKSATGDEKKYRFIGLINRLGYTDCFDIVMRRMASEGDIFSQKIYNDICSGSETQDIIAWGKALGIDFVGYGYPQYTDIKLESTFDAFNADEYIAKALPMYSNIEVKLEGKKPVFWSGGIPLKARKHFYIVRVETMFSIKKGAEPFVRYRGHDILRNDRYTNCSSHYLKNDGWVVLETSDVFDKKTQKYYSSYRDRCGNINNATVILTLGLNDFELFRKKYNVSYLKVLDGCYFL